MDFELTSSYSASPGQAQAVKEIVSGFSKKGKQTLLGITGSGKTFVMANVIQGLQKPTLILAHNKTLAAQLYTELRGLFPQNRVEYFISFYDYYQPESYIPTTDTYIEKDSSRNDEIEKMRMKAVSSLLSRNDTIVVASISCIYGLGNPSFFKEMAIGLKKGEKMTREQLMARLVEIQFERNQNSLDGGKFRARGDVIDLIPVYEKDILRVELAEGKIMSLKEVDAVTGSVRNSLDETTVFPAEQYVVPREVMAKGIRLIQAELERRLPQLPPVEEQRLARRTKYDIEMIQELGYCSGIENYSRHFDGRKEGQPPYVLLDYFPKDFLLIIDESHQSIPQARAMYNGDYARKKNLVDYGFRLPSAFDNRPLKFGEFEEKMPKTLFVSATPAEYELKQSESVSELITRPTGLLDPIVELRPIAGQIPHLISESRKAIKLGGRVLVTTLTKKMAEDLTDFLVKEGLKVRYMHSDIDSLDRIELVRQLRIGEFDILVGINLLREGLDLPEVTNIFILDADKEGFLRDERSLIQTIGRAARNVNGKVVLYADVETKSIVSAMAITSKRRLFQIAFNKKHGITPTTIVKEVSTKAGTIKGIKHLGKTELQRQIALLDARMRKFAEQLDFEAAIEARDQLSQLTKASVFMQTSRGRRGKEKSAE